MTQGVRCKYCGTDTIPHPLEKCYRWLDLQLRKTEFERDFIKRYYNTARMRLVNAHARFLSELCTDLENKVIYLEDFGPDPIARLRRVLQ